MIRPLGLTWSMAVGAWAVLLAGSFAVVHAYMARPGPAASVVPARWPPHTDLGQPRGVARLLVFVHPECPCTDATLSNLSVAMQGLAENASPVDLTVIISGPAAAGGHPQSLARRLETLGKVTMRTDADGSIARDFGAATSGHVVWSDGEGRVGFCGGITPGRGHVGPCESLSMLTAAMQNRGTDQPVQVTPVYGCPIFDVRSQVTGIGAAGSSRDIPICCEQPQGNEP